MKTIGLWRFARAAQVKLTAAALLAAGVAFAGTANAADLPVKAPMIRAPYSYSGCYVGGFFGWGVANDWHTTDVNNFNPGGANPWLFSLNSSPLGGGYVGCNWQPTPGGGFVFGVDGEGGYLSLSAPVTQPFAVGGPSAITDSSKIGGGYGLVAGRIGWVFLEQIHIYGKVGVAFFNDSSQIINGIAPGGGIIATGAKSQTALAFGGGAEYPLTDHWIGKAEYLVFEKGSDYSATGVVGGRTFTWNESPSTVQTFKLGAAYKW
jgi:outer membrane immunogenic protein